MSGGLIQLVAYGVEDLFLTRDPQITFFKVVYRRHTNFSTEPIPVPFLHHPNFGRKTACIIPRQGDLIGQIYLVVTLPAITELLYGEHVDKNFKFAWARKIAFALVRTIDILIAEQLIDRQYGEWLNIWYELMGPREGHGLENMIGNVPELTHFSSHKDEYQLYIPLPFWFCRNSGLALPLVCLQYSEVQINIELNDADRCFLVAPTNYIIVQNDFVNLKQYEYIEQCVDGQTAVGMFTHFDFQTKRLYYMKITPNDFQSLKTDDNVINCDTMNVCESFEPRNLKYLIRGVESNNIVIPKPNSQPASYTVSQIKDLHIKHSFLLIDYIFLDEDERIRFMQTKHDYLIEQVYGGNQAYVIENESALFKVDLIQPCKFVVWFVRLIYLLGINDWFNFTDCYRYKDGKQVGKSLVKYETILINARDRLSFREYQYFNYVQPYQCFPYAPSEGINVYSFALTPENYQPSGSCNMSQLDEIQIRVRVKPIVTAHNKAIFGGYALVYNVLRVVNGLCGLVFQS